MQDSSDIHSFTDVFDDWFTTQQSPPMSLSGYSESPRERAHASQDAVAQAAPPATRPAKHTGQYGQFRSIQEIDPKYRDVFSYPYFNLIQSKVIDDALYSGESLVVCAPTGSGKTVVFEMAVVQLLMELEEQRRADFKIVYMAPVKALCAERLSEWYPKFTRLGLLCVELTGDTDVDFTQLAPYKIIITTPEKWDLLTRRWREFRDLVETVRLFLIDEVHVLHDDTRGPVLEAVVSRMKTIEDSMLAAHRVEQARLRAAGAGGAGAGDAAPPEPRIRFVAVSATIGNPEDVAAWLSTPRRRALYHKLGEEWRPVRLRRVVEGYPCAAGTPMFKFDMLLSYKLWPIIEKYYDGKPTLIFCSTRKSVTMTAQTLAREISVHLSPEQRARLHDLAAGLADTKLRALAAAGVGCHHAGLPLAGRLAVEQAFRARDLPVLVSTTTLAMGVNLPAHLVIIKGTQQYVNGQFQEYPASTVLQMVGRAGRPQYDTEAVAVLMTRAQDKARYLSLVDGGPLESALHLRLAEHLNSEVALGTVTDLAEGVQWARSTFLHVRAARDPRRYLGLPAAAGPDLVAQRMQDMCMKAMNGLARAGLVALDEAGCVRAAPAGRLMALHCLDFDTMKLIMQVAGSESPQELLAGVVCAAHELAGLQLRVDERRTLNALARDLRYPLRGKITTKQMKFNCMIQAIFGCLHIPDPSLHQEALKLLRTADRICKGMVAYFTREEFTKECPAYFAAAVSAVTLAKCCCAGLWEQSPHVCRQLRGVGPALGAALVSAGKTSFPIVEESHPRDLERIMRRRAPAGNELRLQVSLLPKYRVSLCAAAAGGGAGGAGVAVTLELLNAAHMASHAAQLPAADHRAHMLVGDSDNRLLLAASFKDRELMLREDGTLTYWVRRRRAGPHALHAHCISSSLVGVDVKTSLIWDEMQPVSRVRMVEHCELTPSPGAKNITQYHQPASVNKFNKQSAITDSFKERKRRINTAENCNEITRKEKKMCNSVEYIKTPTKSNFESSVTEDKFQNMGKLYQNNTLQGNHKHSNDIDSVLVKNIDNIHIQSLCLSDHISEGIVQGSMFIRKCGPNRLDQCVGSASNNSSNEIIMEDLTDNSNTDILKIGKDMECNKIFEENELIKYNSHKNDDRYNNMIMSHAPVTSNVEALSVWYDKNTVETNTVRHSTNSSQNIREGRNVCYKHGKNEAPYSIFSEQINNVSTSSDEDQPSKKDTFCDKIKLNVHKFLKKETFRTHNDIQFNIASALLRTSHENKHRQMNRFMQNTDTQIFSTDQDKCNEKILSDESCNKNITKNVNFIETDQSGMQGSENVCYKLIKSELHVYKVDEPNTVALENLNKSSQGENADLEQFPLFKNNLILPQVHKMAPYALLSETNEIKCIDALNVTESATINISDTMKDSFHSENVARFNTIKVYNLKDFLKDKLVSNKRITLNKAFFSPQICYDSVRNNVLTHIANDDFIVSDSNCLIGVDATILKFRNDCSKQNTKSDSFDNVSRELSKDKSGNLFPPNKTNVNKNITLDVRSKATMTESRLDEKIIAEQNDCIVIPNQTLTKCITVKPKCKSQKSTYMEPNGRETSMIIAENQQSANVQKLPNQIITNTICKNYDHIGDLKKENDVSKCVSNILDKYGPKLRGIETLRNKCDAVSDFHKSCDLKEAQQAQKKRLFKIKEIDNIDVNILRIIDINESGVAKDHKDEVQRNVTPLVSGQLAAAEDELFKSKDTLARYSRDTEKFDRKLSLPNESLQLNYPPYLDRNMFNPKCLMASCQNDLECLILSPPPAFRDVDSEIGAINYEDVNTLNIEHSSNILDTIPISRNFKTWSPPTSSEDKQLMSVIATRDGLCLEVQSNQIQNEHNMWRNYDLKTFRYTGKEKLKYSQKLMHF